MLVPTTRSKRAFSQRENDSEIHRLTGEYHVGTDLYYSRFYLSWWPDRRKWKKAAFLFGLWERAGPEQPCRLKRGGGV
jgi:hypothetical protein